MDSTETAGIFAGELGYSTMADAQFRHCADVRCKQGNRQKAQNGKRKSFSMTDEEKTTMGKWLLIYFTTGLVCGAFVILMWDFISWKSQAARKSEVTRSSQWIGRFVAGDGDGRIFSAPMIELGLRSDGVIAWRTKQLEPVSLISTQQAEAK